jgi:hypothetical protein
MGFLVSLVPRGRRGVGVPSTCICCAATPRIRIRSARSCFSSSARKARSSIAACATCCCFRCARLLLLLARARFRESLHQPPGRQRLRRQALAAGHRQFLQHARRFAPGRREARGAFGSQLAQPVRPRAGHAALGSHFTCSRSRFAGSGALRAASKASSPAIPAEASANWLARSLAVGNGPHAHRAAPFQRHAARRHAREFLRSWRCPRTSRWFCIRW